MKLTMTVDGMDLIPVVMMVESLEKWYGSLGRVSLKTIETKTGRVAVLEIERDDIGC